MGIDTYMGDAGGGIMTVHHVAKYLRLSEAKIYRMARTGGLPAFRIGRTWRFNKGTIDDWIREKTRMATAQQAARADQHTS